MLYQCRCRLANIVPALGYCPVIAGCVAYFQVLGLYSLRMYRLAI